MKNQHIPNLSTEVPAEIRLEVYKEARLLIDKGETYGLCVILPKALWGLRSIFDKSPDGNSWGIEETPVAFPELTEDIEQRLETATPSGYKKQLRLEYLAKWIQELESKT